MPIENIFSILNANLKNYVLSTKDELLQAINSIMFSISEN